jgi:hypothetical protein
LASGIINNINKIPTLSFYSSSPFNSFFNEIPRPISPPYEMDNCLNYYFYYFYLYFIVIKVFGEVLKNDSSRLQGIRNISSNPSVQLYSKLDKIPSNVPLKFE